MNAVRHSLTCAIIGLLLWLLSYAWVPLSLVPALRGRGLGFLAPIFPLSEAGAIVLAMVGIAFGVQARQHSQPGTAEHRSASRSLALNVVVPVLVVVPNLVFPLLVGS
jgi:hypothetical protein